MFRSSLIILIDYDGAGQSRIATSKENTDALVPGPWLETKVS